MGRSGPRLCALYGSVFEILCGDGGGTAKASSLGNRSAVIDPLRSFAPSVSWEHEQAVEAEAGGEAGMIDELLVALVPKKAQFPVMVVSILILLALIGLALFL